MTHENKGRVIRAGAAVLALSTAFSLSTAAEADHVAQIAATDGGLVANLCIVGEQAFQIPEQGGDFGLRLVSSDIKREIVEDERTLSYSCKFTGIPATLVAFEPVTATGPRRNEDYTIPKGGFRASLGCYDRFDPGKVTGSGTIKITHVGTAMLHCDLRDAYARFDAR